MAGVLGFVYRYAKVFVVRNDGIQAGFGWGGYVVIGVVRGRVACLVVAAEGSKSPGPVEELALVK